jgi:hypothetical protein
MGQALPWQQWDRLQSQRSQAYFKRWKVTALMFDTMRLLC